jgi:mono/diheme cytochrome c family protein
MTKRPEHLHTAGSHRDLDHLDYRETTDITQVHAAVEREHKEPEAGVVSAPLWLLAVSGIAVFWAGAYLGVFNGGFSGTVFDENESSPKVMFPERVAAGGPGAPGGPGAALSPAELGKKFYTQKCVACHQATGMGTPGTFPPLAKSEFVTGGSKRMAAIVLKGLQGPVTVAGGNFNGAMPPWEGDPTFKKDENLAAVLTFVRSSFGNSASEVTKEQIAEARKEFADRKQPWTAAELQSIPPDAELPGGGAPPPPAPAAAPAKAP